MTGGGAVFIEQFVWLPFGRVILCSEQGVKKYMLPVEDKVECDSSGMPLEIANVMTGL